jgi:hypothetical protein
MPIKASARGYFQEEVPAEGATIDWALSVSRTEDDD